MKGIAEEAKDSRLSLEEIKELNDKLNILASQVNEFDDESRSLKNDNEDI